MKYMNKTVFIIIACFLAGIVIFLMMTVLLLQVQKEERATAKPTPLPSLSPTFIPDKRPTARPTVTTVPELAVMDIYPQDKAINVPINNSYIEIFFNQKVTSRDFIFAIQPDITYKFDYSGQDNVKIIFREPLTPLTEYTFSVNTLKQIPKRYTFTTEAATESATLQ